MPWPTTAVNDANLINTNYGPSGFTPGAGYNNIADRRGASLTLSNYTPNDNGVFVFDATIANNISSGSYGQHV